MTFTLNGTETCTGTTDSTGTASCTITPGEPAGTYTVSGTFGGDTTQPVPLTTSRPARPNFVVTPDGDDADLHRGHLAPPTASR